MRILKHEVFNTTERKVKVKDVVEVCYIKFTGRRKRIVADIGIVLEVTDYGFTIVTKGLITKTYRYADPICVYKLDDEF